MGRQDHQPDFRALFYESLGPSSNRRRYGLRFGTSHLFHDAVFLSSLLHDARFSIANVKRKGEKIAIAMFRDLWEHSPNFGAGSTTLSYCPTRLTIAGVASHSWVFREDVPARDQELQLAQLKIDDHFYAPGFLLLLEGLNWQLQVSLKEDGASVTMQDSGRPIPYSSSVS